MYFKLHFFPSLGGPPKPTPIWYLPQFALPFQNIIKLPCIQVFDRIQSCTKTHTDSIGAYTQRRWCTHCDMNVYASVRWCKFTREYQQIHIYRLTLPHLVALKEIYLSVVRPAGSEIPKRLVSTGVWSGRYEKKERKKKKEEEVLRRLVAALENMVEV